MVSLGVIICEVLDRTHIFWSYASWRAAMPRESPVSPFLLKSIELLNRRRSIVRLPKNLYL